MGGINYRPQKAHVLNKTVCIVGTHPNTREKAPYLDKSIDIWVFNNQMTQGWCPRADATFDIHHPNDIHRRRLEQPEFDTFLKTTTMPVYTPFEIPDCPTNKVYPIDTIVHNLFRNFKRGEAVNKYFTSGPGYALALAINLGYKKIMFYGIEMESNSEYIYQRDGIGLLFGVALGKGIEIVIPKESMMFFAPLYGYEDDATKIDREAFETRASELQLIMEQTHNNFQNARGHLQNVVQRIEKMKAENRPFEEIAVLGQEYETAQNTYEQSLANHAFVNGQYMNCREWQGRVEKAMEFGGKSQELFAQNNEKWNRLTDKMSLARDAQ